jgi:Na+/pantothenate symporter
VGSTLLLVFNFFQNSLVPFHRAVVYCDTLQFSAMVLAIVIVMILGTNDAGGVSNVFQIAEEGDRLIWFK